MKNKNGFTLIELLAVIVILAVIITIAVPSTISISNRIKENMFCSKVDFIENAAKLYGEDRRDSFTNTVTIDGTKYSGVTIKVKQLVTTNYLKKDQSSEPYIQDPRDKNIGLDDYSVVIYIKNDRVYVRVLDTKGENVSATCEK